MAEPNYEDFVDGVGHLTEEWKEIQENPNSTDAKYWIKRMGGTVSKEAFGKAYAKETNELITGEYQKKHGSGSTEITAGTETDFAKSSLKELEDYGVDDTQKIQNRKNREKSGAESSGAGETGFTPGQSQYDYGESVESQYKNPDGSVVTDTQFLKYLLNNPDLREHAEALGLYGDQAADWGRWHWATFGKNNPNRINTPFEIKDPGLKTKIHQFTEIPQVYKDLGLKTLDEVFAYSVKSMTPSELWEVRKSIGDEGDADWSLLSFDPTGWRYEADNPYASGLLGGTLTLNKNLPPTDHEFSGKSIGQLVDTKDLRFLQDRFNDAFIANDFPKEWVDPKTNQWTGPAALAGYWNTMTNAYRDEAGNLRSSWDRPPHGWYGFESKVPTGNRGYDTGGSKFGQGKTMGEYLLTDYTRPQLQDLSHLMPPEGLLKTPAQRAMVANQGAVWQPWAQTPEYTWSPTGAATYTPRVLPSLLDSNTEDISTVNGSTKPLFGDPTEWSFYSANFGGPGKGYKFTDFLNWTAWDHAGRPTGSQNNPFTGTWAPVLPTPTS